MGLSIKNEDTVRAVRDLAALTGESLTAAVDTAVRERLARVRPRRRVDEAAIDRILEHYRSLPVVDDRSSKELNDDLYDDDGLPV